MQQSIIRSFLLINPYGIGDALFSTPLIRTLKKQYPHAFMGILLGSRTEALFKFNPDINVIFTYPKDVVKSLPPWKRCAFLFKLNRTIRKYHFECLIDLSNTDEYAFLSKFIWNIPKRIGFQYKKRGKYLTHSTTLDGDFSRRHVVDHYYRLLRHIGTPSTSFEKKLYYYQDPNHRQWLKAFLEKHTFSPSRMIICFLPGGGASWGKKASAKYWPASHYAMLANKLGSLPLGGGVGATLLWIGSSEDHELCETIFKQMNPLARQSSLNLAGETTLPQLASLMSASRLIIGTESGPLHLATALDCASIFLFGPVDPKTYGPYSESQRQIWLNHEVPCGPCYQHFRVPECSNRLCLKELTPEMVFEKACLLLQAQEEIPIRRADGELYGKS